MLIYVIPSVYPNEVNPNCGIYTHEQCKALVKMGHDVVVLDASCFNYKNWSRESCTKIEKSKRDGVNIYANHFRGLATSKVPNLAQVLYDKKLNKLFKNAVKEHGMPDIFYAHYTFTSGYSTYLLSQKTGIPFVVMEHYSIFLQPKLNKNIRKMLIKTVENSNKFICVSESLKNAIEKWTNTKKEICVIPNMIDNAFKYYSRVKSDSFEFFSAGNLIESKGFDILVQAFCLAFKCDENIILNIAGEGNERKEIEKIISDNGRQHQIKLLGRLSRVEMLKKYKECSCFVLPSKFETFGIVYREAMAVGRPVISAKNGGIEDGWEESFGKLVGVNDINGLVDAMKYVFNNIGLYDGKYISNCSVSSYSMDNIATRIIEVFETIIKQ